MKAFLTTSNSTAAGLSAMAYSSPEFFRFVFDQVREQSPTAIVDMHQPADVFSALVDQQLFASTSAYVIKREYESDGDFTDFIDISSRKQPVVVEDLERMFFKEFPAAAGRILNKTATYSFSASDLLTNALADVFPTAKPELLERVSAKLFTELKTLPVPRGEFENASKIAAANPRTKLSAIPADTIINLLNNVMRDKAPTNTYQTISDYNAGLPPPTTAGSGFSFDDKSTVDFLQEISLIGSGILSFDPSTMSSGSLLNQKYLYADKNPAPPFPANV